MRIALSYLHANRRGGIERVMVECIRHLHARGHELEVVASSFDDGVVPAGVGRRLIPAAQRPNFLTFWQYHRGATRALAGDGRFDVHASFGSVSPTGGVMWVPSVHKASLVLLRERRGRPMRIAQALSPAHRALLRMEDEHWRKRKYLRLLAQTDDVRRQLEEFYGVPESDVDVLPLGYQPEEFNIERTAALRDEVREELGFAEDERVVLFVANELERKGFDTLARAVARLNEPQVRLLVVGAVDGSSQRGLLERAGLIDRVTFAGSFADVARAYAAADVFALPTRYEPWGLVIVEALASGVPVLTSRLAGAAVAVRDGDTGELVDQPQDEAEVEAALDRLLRRARPVPDPTVAASVQDYAWSKILDRYEAALIRASG